MKGFLDNVSATESTKLDMLLAEFFYGCNVTFSAVNSKIFRNFISALRPAYKPPNRQRLALNLLNESHDKMIKRNIDLVSKMGKQATVLVDDIVFK